MRFDPPAILWRDPGRFAAALFATLLLFTIALAMSACAVRVEEGPQAVPAPPAAQEGTAQEEDAQTVELEILSQQGSVMAVVPVFINGEGPFAFALDTGASTSLVDATLVQQLNIPTTGTVGPVAGVTGETTAERIRLEQWRAGNVSLPATDGVTLALPEPERGSGLEGLLGSDVLSQFGAVTIDYENELLTLRSRQ